MSSRLEQNTIDCLGYFLKYKKLIEYWNQEVVIAVIIPEVDMELDKQVWRRNLRSFENLGPRNCRIRASWVVLMRAQNSRLLVAMGGSCS